MSKLIPADPRRCQAEKTDWTFMTFGPKVYYRCKNKPIAIGYETVPAKDGTKGSMSFCADCLAVFKEKHPQIYATIRFVPLKRKRQMEVK